MRLLAALVVLTLAGGTLASAGILDEARAEAVARRCFILVDASAEWCGPCKKFSAARESSRKLKAKGRDVVAASTP